jgi:hypothetical protein
VSAGNEVSVRAISRCSGPRCQPPQAVAPSGRPPPPPPPPAQEIPVRWATQWKVHWARLAPGDPIRVFFSFLYFLFSFLILNFKFNLVTKLVFRLNVPLDNTKIWRGYLFIDLFCIYIFFSILNSTLEL